MSKRARPYLDRRSVVTRSRNFSDIGHIGELGKSFADPVRWQAE